jgi:hypothetical protein
MPISLADANECCFAPSKGIDNFTFLLNKDGRGALPHAFFEVHGKIILHCTIKFAT